MSKKILAGLVVGALMIVAGVLWQKSTAVSVTVMNVTQKIVSDVLMTPVGISEMSVNMGQRKASLQGLTMKNPEGFSREFALELKGIDAELDTDATSGNLLVIKSMHIDTPHVAFESDNPGDSNIHVLLKNLRTTPDEKVSYTQNPDLRIIIDELTISGGVMKASAIDTPEQFLNLKLPDTTVSGIGRVQGGISVDDAARLVSGELFNSVVKTAMNSRIYNRLKANDKSWMDAIRKNTKKNQ